jgi:hypothetical protein
MATKRDSEAAATSSEQGAAKKEKMVAKRSWEDELKTWTLNNPSLATYP